MNDQTTPLV